jgi:hypothetical protein
MRLADVSYHTAREAVGSSYRILCGLCWPIIQDPRTRRRRSMPRDMDQFVRIPGGGPGGRSVIVGHLRRIAPFLTHDHGPPAARGVAAAARALRRVSRVAQWTDCESIDCRPRPRLSPLVSGLINCPRKKKFQQSFSESNAFDCAVPYPAAAPARARPRRGRRIRAATGGDERTRSHTVAASLARRPPRCPYAAAMAMWADILTGARRPAEAGGRAPRAVSRVGWHPRRASAGAVHGQCAESAPGGPETRRSPMPSRRCLPAAPPRAVLFPLIGGPARAHRPQGATSSHLYHGHHRRQQAARLTTGGRIGVTAARGVVRIFAKVQGDSP